MTGNILLAIIIRREYKAEGIEFFTEHEFSQQLGYMNRPRGYRIAPHKHRELSREVKQTQEVLLVRSGKLRVDLYTDEHILVESVVVQEGDVILLASGGHGFEMLEDSEIIEVKQGPYHGDQDKIQFE